MRAEVDGEYRFQVTADGGSRVALSVSRQELFNDLLVEAAGAPTADTTGGNAVAEGRTGSLVLPAGEFVPLQLQYAVRRTKIDELREKGLAKGICVSFGCLFRECMHLCLETLHRHRLNRGTPPFAAAAAAAIGHFCARANRTAHNRRS